MSTTSTDPFSAFAQDVREDIDGLIWLGHLEDNFPFCGHDFSIRLLRGDEELIASLLVKEYMDGLGQAKAHVWSIVALSLTAVDGAEDFCPPQTNNKLENARARFRWVTGNWFWPTGIAIYNRYMLLAGRQTEAIKAIEDFYNGSQPSPTPYAGSSTDRASSEVPPLAEDITQYLDPQDDSTESNFGSPPS